MNRKITLLEDDDYDLNDDIAPEYNFAKLPRASEQERKFRALAKRRLISLAPDVAEVFTSAEAVSEALRQLIREKKAA
ncbi:MAG TPA: hypothetical protein VFZ34_19595 [Blastocatellia bacterium]|nr:hypothetical protein [Blastocatellia bacterium]